MESEIDDVDDDLLPDGYHETTILETFLGAWREALAEDGLARVLLVYMMLLMTVLYLPILPIIWLLEKLGVWSLD